MLIIVDVLSGLVIIFVIAAYFVYVACKTFYGMDPDEAKYMRTERKPGTLDVHPTLNAIVLNYEIEVQILGAKEHVIYGEKKVGVIAPPAPVTPLCLQNLKKIIELPMLNSRTDCYALAKEVVYQCDLIHHSRSSEVEQTIYYLKKRKLGHGTKGANAGRIVYF
jgi:hypothetical protein